MSSPPPSRPTPEVPRPNMLRSMLPIGIMFMLPKFLDMKDPQVIRVAYVAYAAVAAISFILTRGLVERVTKARLGASGDAPVWLPPPAANPLAFLTGAATPSGPSFKKTTLRDHEIQLATEKENAMIGLAVPLALSYFMGAHIMLVMHFFLEPLKYVDEPFLRRWVVGPYLGEALGGAPPSGVLGVYGEVSEEPLETNATASVPSIDAPAVGAIPRDSAVVDEPAAPAAAATNSTADEASSASVAFEEAILGTWESKSEAPDIGRFRNLIKKDVTINTPTSVDGYTALGVVCGHPLGSTRDVEELVSLGASLFLADNEGWTPLHWAAFHGCPETARALVAAFKPDELSKGISLRTKDGYTAIELAEGRGQPDGAPKPSEKKKSNRNAVAAIIAKAQGPLSAREDDEQPLEPDEHGVFHVSQGVRKR